MADHQASAQGPSSSEDPQGGALVTLEFTNEQICELETAFCSGQYSEIEGANQQVLGSLSAEFTGVSAAFVEAWFRQRAADGQAPTSVVIQTIPQTAADMSAEQRRQHYHKSHDKKKFNRQKKGVFQHMERFAADNPGADIMVVINSPSSLFMWADGRGPYMNADSVLKASAQSVGEVLKDAAARSQAGTLDWQQNPGQRSNRGTKHKGGGYMLFQADYRQTAIAQLRAAGIPLKKGVIERKCKAAWTNMSEEHQADYHRQPRRTNEQRSAQADTQTATTSGGGLGSHLRATNKGRLDGPTACGRL